MIVIHMWFYTFCYLAKLLISSSWRIIKLSLNDELLDVDTKVRYVLCICSWYNGATSEAWCCVGVLELYCLVVLSSRMRGSVTWVTTWHRRTYDYREFETRASNLQLGWALLLRQLTCERSVVLELEWTINLMIINIINV